MKRAAGHAVRKAWRKLGKSLQSDYVHSQRVSGQAYNLSEKGSQEVGIICDYNVLCEEEEVRARWKNYFASLLLSDQKQYYLAAGSEGGDNQDANRMDADCTWKISVGEVRECIGRLKYRQALRVSGLTG